MAGEERVVLPQQVREDLGLQVILAADSQPARHAHFPVVYYARGGRDQDEEPQDQQRQGCRREAQRGGPIGEDGQPLVRMLAQPGGRCRRVGRQRQRQKVEQALLDI